MVDRRVYKEEVDTFVKSVKQLNDAISPDTFMTEGMVFDWFKSNRERVGNLLIGKDAELNIKNAIIRTKNIPGKSAIIRAMEGIANADSDFHKSENNIIRRAAYGWSIPYP